MSKLEDGSCRQEEQSLGDIFVTITGETTVTQKRHTTDSRRPAEEEDIELSEYLAFITTNNGLEETIESPQSEDFER